MQITAPLGRAADRPELLLQPWDLLELMPRIARLKEQAYRERILIMPGNNLGYFGPEEALLRSVQAGGRDHWRGCQAGRYVLGIESDGAVKGCPSLQTAHYVGGNLRERPLERIWNDSPELAFTRGRTVEDLWGFCRTCPFAEVCMGGLQLHGALAVRAAGQQPLLPLPGEDAGRARAARAAVAQGARAGEAVRQRPVRDRPRARSMLPTRSPS